MKSIMKRQALRDNNTMGYTSGKKHLKINLNETKISKIQSEGWTFVFCPIKPHAGYI